MTPTNSPLQTDCGISGPNTKLKRGKLQALATSIAYRGRHGNTNPNASVQPVVFLALWIAQDIIEPAVPLPPTSI